MPFPRKKKASSSVAKVNDLSDLSEAIRELDAVIRAPARKRAQGDYSNHSVSDVIVFRKKHEIDLVKHLEDYEKAKNALVIKTAEAVLSEIAESVDVGIEVFEESMDDAKSNPGLHEIYLEDYTAFVLPFKRKCSNIAKALNALVQKARSK